MTAEKPTHRSLTNLLNRLEVAHKKDVQDFSGGYLNESNLYKQPRDLMGATWQSAKPDLPSVRLNKYNGANSADKERDQSMKYTLKNFTLGASGTVAPPQYLKRSRREGTKGPVRVDRVVSVSSQGSYSQLDDGVLVENMGGANTMIRNYHSYKPVSWADYDYAEDGYKKPFSQGGLKDQNLAQVKHKFIPSHLNSVTKKDQFKRMTEFENNVLQKNDMLEQNVMTGVKAVEHLEVRLREDLDNLQVHGYGPNFHRLQIYSNTFEDLIDDSPTFKYILGTIKKEYDDYISSLLDQQPSRHKLLYEQVEQLSERGTSNPALLKEEQQRLDKLQLAACDDLAENERLRKELEEERILAENLPEEEEENQGNIGFTEPDLDLADKIEEAHAAILEKLDQIKELRQTLRREYVPSTVVTHLEQCIKETEVESQRYQSQKEFFERSCAEMEKDLRDAIENADTTEKDAKRIWKKVLQRIGENDSEDGEEEAKWNWYIS